MFSSEKHQWCKAFHCNFSLPISVSSVAIFKGESWYWVSSLKQSVIKLHYKLYHSCQNDRSLIEHSMLNKDKLSDLFTATDFQDGCIYHAEIDANKLNSSRYIWRHLQLHLLFPRYTRHFHLDFRRHLSSKCNNQLLSRMQQWLVGIFVQVFLPTLYSLITGEIELRA